MLFSVLLVDDEPNVRQGIKMMIPWEDIGCTVIGEADDGDDGLGKIMALRPDIVIADIKMPGKTGIEMSEAAKALGFKGKILILSGYSDFAYAKEAIALGVENFILKPVDEDELAEAIKSCGEKLLREQEHMYQQKKGTEYINEQLVKGLFAGIDDMTAAAAAKLDYYSYTACIISCESGDDPSECYRRIRDFFKTVRNVDIITIDLSGVLGVLFKGWMETEVDDILKKLHASMKSSVFIAVGDTVSTIYKVKSSYSTANDIFSGRFLYKHMGLVTPAVFRSRSIGDNETDFGSSIYAYIEINDTQKLEKTLDSFMNSLRDSGSSPENAKISCITLMMDMRSRIIKGASGKKADTLISEKFISELSGKDSLYDIISEMKKSLVNVSNSCFGRTTKSTMERIVRYIESNYNHELRLEMLAGIFGYNSAYLGKVFHQYTGENFNNYLDKIRITEAKRLLVNEEYKVYEVAETVGYTNINYFHNKFKKYVGVSPLTYKKCKGELSQAQVDQNDDE